MRPLGLPAVLAVLFAATAADACFLKKFCGKGGGSREPFQGQAYLPVMYTCEIETVNGYVPDPVTHEIGTKIDSTRTVVVIVVTNFDPTNYNPHLIMIEGIQPVPGPVPPAAAARKPGDKKKYVPKKIEPRAAYATGAGGVGPTQWATTYEIDEMHVQPNGTYYLTAHTDLAASTSPPVKFVTN